MLFVHDGSAQAPSYDVAVRDGALSDSGAAGVTFTPGAPAGTPPAGDPVPDDPITSEHQNPEAAPPPGSSPHDSEA